MLPQQSVMEMYQVVSSGRLLLMEIQLLNHAGMLIRHLGMPPFIKRTTLLPII